MKKQTSQLIFGFFLIFSAFPAFADFAATTDGLYQRLSGCASPTTFEAACAADDCGKPTTTTAIICPNSGCTGNQVKYVFGCTGSPSCPSNSTRVGNTATCSCNSGFRQNTSIGLIETTISCDTHYNAPSDDILAYAIGAGLFAGGTGASFAACGLGLNPACIASALTAAAGAGLALATYLNSGDSSTAAASPDPCAGKVCMSVQLDPNKPLTGTHISRDSDGNFKPEGEGWNNNGDGTHTAEITDGTVTVDTNTDRVISTVTNSTGATANAVLQSGNNTNGVEFVTQGKNSDGTATQSMSGSVTDQAILNNQNEATSGTLPTSTGGLYNEGSIGGSGSGSGSGDSGSGSGSGEGEGGDCAEYGCAKEETQLKVLEALEGGGDINHEAEGQNAVGSITDGLEDLLGGYSDEINQKIDDFMEDSELQDLFDQLGDFNPLNFDTSTCSIDSELWGQTLNLSYCDEQETIHWILGFIFFVLFTFAVINLILERNH